MGDKGIDKYIQDAYAALKAAEELAEESGTSFEFSPAYGMGGTYYSKKYIDENQWVKEFYYRSGEEGTWVSSSETC